MTEIVITAAKRTPVGSFLGAFAATPAHELGRVAITAALEQAGIKGEDVSEVILGQVLTAAQGQNPARQASIAAGIPKEVPAYGVNQVCGSGLRAVALGLQAIANGDATIVVAGGQESMSLSPHAQTMRGGTKMGPLTMVDTMVHDGLTDAFAGYHMGITAENLAEQYQVTRDDQDRFAVRSQNLAEKARGEGRFKDEIAPVTIKTRKGETVVADDEYIRAGATLESVSGVRPAFKKDGTVTAANASGLNDGAAALVLMSREEAEKARHASARGDQELGLGGRRPVGDGHRPRPGHPARAGKGGLERRRPRPDRGQRSLCRPSPVGRQGAGFRPRQGQRQRRRDRAGPSDRCQRRAGAHDPDLRNAEARRQKGPRHFVHRRRHGHRHVC
ncbi:acetyl-CoA acetyltransferase [Sphingomonas sp. SORGH_AS742]|nr:acetyl-CoA acetyltransferase [Sphingomonas sp. SORGH_AS_0742]